MEEKEVKDANTDEQQTEQQTQEQTPDKAVEASQFAQYRQAYLQAELKKLNVKEGAETDAALKFIDSKADSTDSNLPEVMEQLAVRMRLDKRKAYVDPNLNNGARQKPKQVDKHDIGVKSFERIKNKIRRGSLT